jgi:drug/metabolite transporter (DMT)-like permease
MISKNKKYESGILFVLIFVVLGAFQEVYLGHLVQKVSPILVMTVTFAMALVFFNFWVLKRQLLSVVSIKKHFKLITALNVTTALSWFGFMMAIKYLEPAIVSCICFSLSPILTSAFNPFFNRGNKVLAGEVVSAIGMALGVVILTYSSVAGVSGLGTQPTSDILFGIMAATISAFGIMGNTFFSKKMSVSGFGTMHTMSLRFYLLIFLGAISLLVFPPNVPITIAFTLEMLILSVSTVILPLFLLQIGIERLEPITVSLLISSMPVVTFFLQFFDQRITPSLTTLMGVSICFIASVVGVFLRYNSEIKIEVSSENGRS